MRAINWNFLGQTLERFIFKFESICPRFVELGPSCKYCYKVKNRNKVAFLATFLDRIMVTFDV